MKKLLIFMLVLGMASMAGATVIRGVDLQISVNGNMVEEQPVIVLFPSDTVILDIYTPTGTPLNDARDYALLVATTCGTINGGVAVPPGGVGAGVSWKAWIVSPASENIYEYPEGTDGEVFSHTANPQAIPAGQKIFDYILFHCESNNGLTAVILGALDLDWNWTGEIYDTVVFNQVPEPMTIALLGLGGLLLKRRK